jgi:hypothetical protein
VSKLLVPTYVGDGTELSKKYRAFWRSVHKLLGGKASREELALEISQAVRQETLLVSFGAADAPLTLTNVQNPRGAPLTSSFDVYLFGKQYVGRHETEGGGLSWIILRAEFQVLYLNSMDRAAIRKHWDAGTSGSMAYVGYRFISNSEFPHAENYPDCHVSYCLNGISEESIKRRYREGGNGWRVRAGHGQPHIPSAPMDLCAIVYMLLHCHRPESVELGWPEETRKLVADLPSFWLESNERSSYPSWYLHSHELVEDPAAEPLRRSPADFRVPPNAKAARWGARIWGHETVETPHLTINHGQTEKWRLDLRTGNLLPGDRGDIHPELLAELDRTKEQWKALWDDHYAGANNKVGESTW